MTSKADILVVDDDAEVRELFSRVLREQGYRVREAGSGAEGLQSVRTERPDVMLLDVKLPDLSGVEVCRRIKGEAALAEVFVIMVSGEALSPAERVDGLDVGADEYLTKPLAIGELVARVRTGLRLRDTLAALRHKEEYHRQLIEILPDALCVLDLRGRIVSLNSRALAMLGYAEAEELRNESVLKLVPRAARARLRAEIAALMRTGILQNAQWEVARKDGGSFSVELSAVSLAGPEGRPQGFVLLARDITDRKWVEGQVRLMAHALQSTHEVVYVADERLRIRFVNRAALETYGYREEELVGRSPDFLHSPNEPPGLWHSIFEHGIHGRWKGEVSQRRKDGSEFPVELSTSQIKDSKGGTVGLVCVARDISKPKRAERQRTAFSELGYRLSAAATPEEAAAVILDIACELFGCDAGYIGLYSQAEDKIIPVLAVETVGGQRERIPAVGSACAPSALIRLVMREGARLINRGDPMSAGMDLPAFGEVTRRSACRMHAPIRGSGVVYGILSIQSYRPGAYSQDDLELLEALAGHCGGALERIKVAETLRETEARYRSIFEKATEGIFQTTLEGRFLNVNPAQARMLGYETPGELKSEVTNAGRQLYVNPARRKEMLRLLEESGSLQGFEAELCRKDGRKIWVTINEHLVRDSKGAALYLEGTAQDVTERKRLEKLILELSEREQRRVAQDIHDGLCQRLFCIALGCNQLRETLGSHSRAEAGQAAKLMAQIDAAISEARNVAYGLSLANLDKRGLPAALRDLASTSSLDSRIACVAECPDLVCISNPATAQHLYRIAREAVHNAVKHAKPSRILIRLEATADGGCLSITDDGSGIPEAKSRGSGMGLDMMQYRASMVGGALKVQRAPSRGTIITCTFPGSAS